MDSTRQLKVARLLQKELGTYFQQQGNTLCHGKMVTVTRARVTPDLSVGRIYLSIFPATDIQTDLNFIRSMVKSIRNVLAKSIRHQVRIIPNLEFFLDDSQDYFYHIDELLKK